MRYFKYISLFVLMFALTSCYHAQITTDKEPSNNVIEEEWAHSFVFGLVPPSEVEASSECSNGVARVETQISFLNGLVRALTSGLYTPMTITVTCATGSDVANSTLEENVNMTLKENSSNEEVANKIQEAANKSSKIDKPVYIKFE